MTNLYVIIGAFLGTLARYLIYQKLDSHSLGTFIVNTVGAFLFGAVVGSGSHGNLYILLADGLLGSFTTFSALVWETQHKLHKDKDWDAIVYVGFSVFAGITGFILARFIFRKI